MFTSVESWWLSLKLVSALNLLLWLAVATHLWRHAATLAPDERRERQWLALLSLGYLLGCGWRSLLPVFDVPRIVLVDSIWSGALVGRIVATSAELCFAAQWALLLRRAGRELGSRSALHIGTTIVPLILLAELFSWSSVLTLNNLGHAVEESLWALSAAGCAVALVVLLPRAVPAQRPGLLLLALTALGYVAYMAAVDVPMYAGRWLRDEAAGLAYLGWAEGLVDAATRRVVTHDFAVWQGEMTWMTLYFSVAVWLSIALVLLPRLRPAAVRRPARRWVLGA